MDLTLNEKFQFPEVCHMSVDRLIAYCESNKAILVIIMLNRMIDNKTSKKSDYI